MPEREGHIPTEAQVFQEPEEPKLSHDQSPEEQQQENSSTDAEPPAIESKRGESRAEKYARKLREGGISQEEIDKRLLEYKREEILSEDYIEKPVTKDESVKALTEQIFESSSRLPAGYRRARPGKNVDKGISPDGYIVGVSQNETPEDT